VQVLATQRQQYAQQANENNMVKQELDLVGDDAKVYKLIGPVLLKQEVAEAKTNVKKRLEFINNELYVGLLPTPLSFRFNGSAAECF
jgi:prefoldin beta subunit